MSAFDADDQAEAKVEFEAAAVDLPVNEDIFRRTQNKVRGKYSSTSTVYAETTIDGQDHSKVMFWYAQL